ncbi:MAG: AAA family ATPase [PVC group bacterium]|nr:AAA family ATPase [PVC group bacterium]
MKIPANYEYEKALIACAILNRDALLTVVDMSVDDFYFDICKSLFLAIVELHESNKNIDAIVLNDMLAGKSHYQNAGGDVFLAELYQSRAQTGNFKSYYETVKSLSGKREIGNAYKDAIQRMKSVEDIDDIISDVDNIVRDVMDTGKDELGRIIDLDLDWITKTENCIKTGFSDIDSRVGGLHDDELILLAARPSMGKSALGFEIAMNVARKYPVLFFSLEMPARQLGQRVLANITNLDLYKFRRNRLDSDDMAITMERWEQFRKSRKDLYINDTIFELNKIINACKRYPKKPGLIVIDYLQLMKVPSQEKRYIAVGEISRSLKMLAKELHCPVLALSQLNRSVESRVDMVPKLSDLRESGDLEQDADMVMFLHGEKEENKRTVIVAKNRNGKLGKIDLWFRQNVMQFQNMSQ